MLGLRFFVSALLRAYASIVLAKRRTSGCLVLAATLLYPSSGGVALFSAALATALALQLGYSRSAIEHGHYGYNAVLVGLAAAHDQPLSFELLALTALAALGSVVLTAVLSDLFWRGAGLPVLALPALLVMALSSRSGALTPFTGSAQVPLVVISHSFGELADHALRTCGAVVFDPSRAAGMLVLAAVLVYSRLATLLGLAGVSCAMLVSRQLGESTHGTVALAASYNAALSALAVGATFFVPGSAALVAALLTALGAAFFSIVMARSNPASAVWAWPFVVVTLLGLRALRLRGSSRAPFESPLPLATPERNRDYSMTLRTRFGAVAKPRLLLPFDGTWFVSQGVDGDFTHRGPWAHALDFEIADADGFPFRNQGRVVEEYYCYGQPVLAPGSGTVVAVHDGAPDQAPGHQDTIAPWGNAIVLQHGPGLFSVLAHLQAGTLSVKTGDFVIAGQRLARVGSSGRSPRPHLHLQMQRSAELGAPTLEFDLLSYAEQQPGRALFSALGVPKEGTRLFAVPSAGPAILGLTPGTQKECVCDGVPLRLRYELDLHGEHSLVDVERGDRVYFLPGPVLTTYAGSPSSPLAALYWAIPRLPLTHDVPLAFEEGLMPGDSLPALWSGLRFVLTLLGLRCELLARGVVERSHGQLTVRTTTELRVWKYSLASWSAKLDIGPHGLESISRTGRRARSKFRELWRIFVRFSLPSKEPNHVSD